MEDLGKKHNIIETNEDYIGRVEDLKKYFIDVLVYNMGEIETVEEKIGNIALISDILNQLEEEQYNVVIRICYDSMGEFYIADSLDG